MPRETVTERQARMWRVEHELLAAGARYIAGVDEAGRGPLAGPVVAAAVILPVDWFPAGLNDSKQVKPAVREQLAEAIRATALAWTVEVVPVAVIDDINILRATHRGMVAALQALAPAPDVALIDGLPITGCPVRQHNLVKGDSHSASIAAASILAKVDRDRIMRELHAAYPHYGFDRHKGYGTADHLAALRAYGPCPAHRRSFAPVQACGQARLTLD